MKIILFSRRGIELPRQDIEAIFGAIERYGFDYTINRAFAEGVESTTSYTIAPERIYDGSVGPQPEDAVMVCYGGDGTLLEGVHRLDGADIPVVGINGGHLGFTMEMIENPETCSLDAPAGEEAGTLGILLEDLQAPQPQEALVRRELEAMMEQLLSHLDDRQRTILRLHFGMEDGICYSLEEIGKKLNISKERVRQVEKQAMEKLQKLGTNLGLEDFLVE